MDETTTYTLMYNGDRPGRSFAPDVSTVELTVEIPETESTEQLLKLIDRLDVTIEMLARGIVNKIEQQSGHDPDLYPFEFMGKEVHEPVVYNGE